MASVNSSRKCVEALHRQARAQLNALGAIAEVFAQEAEHLHRHDQAQSLDALQEKVAREVSHIRMMEDVAFCSFTKGTLISAAMKFALGAMIGAAARTGEHPLSVGLQLAQSDLGRTAPFGAVVVAVGSGGVPDDVSVVPLSRWARELDSTERQLMTALKTRGYRLMTPEVFFKVLDDLKEKVLNKVLDLPVKASSLAQLVDRDPE